MVGEIAVAVVLVAWWFIVEGSSIASSVPVRTESFVGSPYAALTVIGFGLVFALARSRPQLALGLLGVILVCQLLFWPARLSQTGWTAYLILLAVPYLLAASASVRNRRLLAAAVVPGALAVAALLTLPSFSMSGEWGTINGKPWDAPGLWPDVAVWSVICLCVALGMWALGSRSAHQGAGAPSNSADRAETNQALLVGSPAGGSESLSPREREIFGLVASGMSNAEIAKRAFVAETTVKTHVSSILRKLNARSRSELIAMAHADAGAER
ncbi:hypothetical protein GCM10009748_33540 [Agromyces lapidis]